MWSPYLCRSDTAMHAQGAAKCACQQAQHACAHECKGQVITRIQERTLSSGNDSAMSPKPAASLSHCCAKAAARASCSCCAAALACAAPSCACCACASCCACSSCALSSASSFLQNVRATETWHGYLCSGVYSRIKELDLWSRPMPSTLASSPQTLIKGAF